MLEKLKEIERRYTELEECLSAPEVYGDADRLRQVNREMKELGPLVETFRAYCRAREDQEGALGLLSDPELKEMAQEELAAAKAEMERLEGELKLLLLPRDPNDEKNVVMEIRAGTGGEEAALFARDLFRMYTMYAESKGWHLEVVGENETELGGVKEISFLVEGQGVWSRLKFESGVHRVQRVPVTESSGRIQTSAATVAVLPEAEEVELELNPADIRIDLYRASGAGGQHVNRTDSAVRLTHIPTGVVVECQDERSQGKNKEKAMRVLRSRIYDMLEQQKTDEYAQQRRLKVGSGDRSERIRTYNYPQGRVTDHRIGLTLYKLDSFLAGDMDEMLDALALADRTERMRQETA